MKFPLRPYQESAKSLSRQAVIDGHKRVITEMATGSGKTRLFIDVADSARIKGKKIVIVMRRRSLIFQTAKAYKKFTGYEPGVIIAGEKEDRKNPVQIVSIDTINRRMKKPEYSFLVGFDMLIVDECHDATSQKYRDFLHLFSDKIWMGYTATCLPTGNKYLEDWDTVVLGPSAANLRDMGFLAPERTFAPKKMDLTGIKTIAGEYDQKALAERAMSSSIVGDTIEVWKSYGENRLTLAFGVNIEHSKMCAERMRQSGVSAMHIDSSHNTEERDAAIEKLKKGIIKVLWSVGVFSTGTDIPSAATLLFARPTKSEILYVQIIGRILRMFKVCASCRAECGAESTCYRCNSTQFTDVKKDAIIIDQANNCERFGLAYDPRSAKIRPPDKKKAKVELDDEAKIKTCEECYCVYEASLSECPMCDHTNAKTKREIAQEEGELELKRTEDLRYGRMLVIKNDLMKFSNPRSKASAKWTRLHAIYGDEIFEFKKELEIPVWARAQITRNKKGARKFTRTL